MFHNFNCTPPAPADRRFVSRYAYVLPDGTALNEVVVLALARYGHKRNVMLIERSANPYTSTYPSEVLTIRFDDNGSLKLLCKYGVDDGGSSHGQRRGVAYEGMIYDRVLSLVGMSTIGYYGTHMNPAANRPWLILEYHENALLLSSWEQPEGVLAGARWIGRFHAATKDLLPRLTDIGINRYDWSYYDAWARRTLEVARAHGRDAAWLERLCAKAPEVFRVLADEDVVLVHGEYYPKNILLRDGVVFPLDWETAAVAAGEIDLATLTENWPPEHVESCLEVYAHARWLEGPPSDFGLRFDIARLYCQLRWVGDRDAMTRSKQHEHRFADLRSLGERLGLI